jgi:radical SAM superfamily enzyme YgiQ (UPF0313 family)
MRAANDLGYAAAALRERDYDVIIRDWQTEGATNQQAFEELSHIKPALVLISVTNASINQDLAFVRTMRERLGEACVIVLKGSIFWDPPIEVFDALDFSDADYLVGGEIEYSISALADYALSGRGALAEIPNLYYRIPARKRRPDDDGTLCGTVRFEPTFFSAWEDDLDRVAFPARDLMDNDLYVNPATGKTMATIQATRGCSARCTYCLSPVLSGNRIRSRSAQNIVAELRECYFEHDISEFFFRADTFTMDEAWVAELCGAILASDLAGRISFVVNARTRPLSEKTLQQLADAGCTLIAFGYESGSDETLRRIGKATTIRDNRNAARWARHAGLEVFGFFMVGFPWEDEAALDQTRAHIFELEPDYLEIHLAYPYYGTALHEQFRDAGLLVEAPIGYDYFSSSITGTSQLSAADLALWRTATLRAFYRRPRFLLRTVARLLRQPRRIGTYLSYASRLR